MIDFLHSLNMTDIHSKLIINNGKIYVSFLGSFFPLLLVGVLYVDWTLFTNGKKNIFQSLEWESFLLVWLNYVLTTLYVVEPGKERNLNKTAQ